MTLSHDYAPATWGHSSSIGSRAFVIFCVGQDIRKVAAFRIWATSENIGFKSLKGCYNGQTEDSFIVALTDYPKVTPWTDGEDSVLVLGSCDARDRRPARLMFNDGSSHHLGLFHSCSREEALKRQSWTYDPTQNTYFICSKYK